MPCRKGSICAIPDKGKKRELLMRIGAKRLGPFNVLCSEGKHDKTCKHQTCAKKAFRYPRLFEQNEPVEHAYQDSQPLTEMRYATFVRLNPITYERVATNSQIPGRSAALAISERRTSFHSFLVT